MAKHGKLTDEHRAFLVREIAAFESPSKVAEAVNQEFGIQISRQAVEKYDPSKNRKLSKKWRAHFDFCRKAFRERIEDEIASANKFVRVRQLERIALLLEKRNNVLGQAQILEQIAKECGNVHTNKRELTGKDGGPMQLQDVATMSPEQVSDELRAALADPATRAMLAALTQNTEAPAIPPTLTKESENGQAKR